MIKQPALIYFMLFACVLLLASVNLSFIKKQQQENHPPTVKIINPKNNSPFNWDTPINYEITVSDKEDGDTKFDEINAKEVLLEVRYFNRSSKINPVLNASVNNALGLDIIRTSNCFNCHEFNGKSIGPSFYDISKRYPATSRNIDTLTKRVREGSSGNWGKEKMPTHTELTVTETKSAVQWLLKNATLTNINYYIGTKGAFRVRQPAITDKTGGICLLIASYLDHGLKNAPAKRLTGQDVIILATR